MFILVKALMLLIPVLICVAYYTLAERKVAAYIQGRVGANRVGWRGMLQPFADALKFITKEYIKPRNANSVLFYLAPTFHFITSVFILGETLVFAKLISFFVIWIAIGIFIIDIL